jgi:shikimate kinase
MGKQTASLSRGGPSTHDQGPLNRTITLVGFMGAGKTSVGKELAGLLGWSFEDLDDRIQAREQRTIEEIFRDSGEVEFRRCEHMALRELLSETESASRVIALGGGAFAQTENASLLQDRSIPSVFLDAPVEELFRRCKRQRLKRPLHQDETHFRELYEMRRPLYMAATCRVETGGKPIGEIAAEIAKAFDMIPRTNPETV